MERKSKRTVISIEEYQPEFDFEEAEQFPPFTFPEYQRDLVSHRAAAGLIDFGIVTAVYVLFLTVTYFQMPDGLTVDRTLVGIYGAAYFLLVTIYFLLFMLSASQTPGMKKKQLIVVSKDGMPLDPQQACMRGLGYLVSILPVMLGFIWALIDPEHLTWADKVSGTFVKKL